MEIGTVSTLALTGMGFTAAICFLLPVGLVIYLAAAKKAKLSVFLLGCATFIFSAMVLEPILHNMVQGALVGQGKALTDNMLLYAIYGGMAAAAFEETGRYIAMKHLMKAPKAVDGIMYGVGHGGIEALLLGTLNAVSNLSVAMMVNGGSFEATLAGMDAALRDSYLENISQLWTLPGSVFFLSGVERVLAMALQVALSVLMYRGVKAASNKHIAWAYLLHFLVDACAVLAAQALPVIAVELLLLVAVIAVWVFLALPAYKECADGEKRKKK